MRCLQASTEPKSTSLRSTGAGAFDDPDFLRRLRNGEEAAYRQLIRRFHTSLVSVASAIIGSRAHAEEVVQDTWLAVFSNIRQFEGRSSLATWLFSIALNRARSRIRREGRTVALPSILERGQPGDRDVAADAFRPDGCWAEPVRAWDELNPERIVAHRQLWEHVRASIERLPPAQRSVITLRDVEGRSSEEVCELLSISPENQRVLLHRARTSIRNAMDHLMRHPAVRPTTHPAFATAQGPVRFSVTTGIGTHVTHNAG